MKISPRDLAILKNVLRRLGEDSSYAELGLRAPHPFITAIHLGSRNLRMLPTRKSTKVPHIRNWPELATFDPLQLVQWQAQFNPNWSILTGRANGVFVLDGDGPQGKDDLIRLQQDLGALPPTWRTVSPRLDGGFHLYFRLPPGTEDLRNQQPLRGTKIDVRGYHGYVVVPGSLHMSGRRYVWDDGCSPDEVELAECPPTWWEWLPKRDGAQPAARQHSSRTRSSTVLKHEHQRGSYLIGDGPQHGGFQDPIYRNAIRFFLQAGPNASRETLIELLWELIQQAPKVAGRSVDRYHPGNGDLERIVDRARDYVLRIKGE
jgi:hypothetical protein